MILPSAISERYFHEWFSKTIFSNPEISSCSDTNLVDMSNICLCETCVVHNGVTSVLVILSQEYGWFHCYSHKHSQVTECFSPFSHLIITRFTNHLDSTDNSHFCFIVSNDEMLRPCNFWRIAIKSPRCVTRCFLVHNGLRSSVVKSFLVRETRSNFSCRPPRSFIRSPRSVVCLKIGFPLLRWQSTVVNTHWRACWREPFHKLFMVIVVGNFQPVFADITSPPSLLFLSNWTPGILISVTSLHRAYWSRG